jgi:hypothetical protein
MIPYHIFLIYSIHKCQILLCLSLQNRYIFRNLINKSLYFECMHEIRYKSLPPIGNVFYIWETVSKPSKRWSIFRLLQLQFFALWLSHEVETLLLYNDRMILLIVLTLKMSNKSLLIGRKKYIYIYTIYM